MYHNLVVTVYYIYVCLCVKGQKGEKLFMRVVLQFHSFIKMILHVCGVFSWNECELPSLHSRKHTCSWDHVMKTEYSRFSNL